MSRSSQGTGSTSMDTAIHLMAGGMGGTAGAIVTCPLEVVKTRLQSSNSGFGRPTLINTNNNNNNAHQINIPDIAAEKRSVGTVQNASQSVTQNLRQSGNKESFAASKKKSRFGGLSRYLEMAEPGKIGSNQQWNTAYRYSSSHAISRLPPGGGPPRPMTNVFECLRYIVATEGPRGLFRGLGPNLVGVAPSRAIYFFTYSTAKRKVDENLPKQNRDTPFVHVVSAASAGFCASTCTNPIWLVKTRLQLDRSTGLKTMTVSSCVRAIFHKNGLRGFWKGVTASYWGISETVIHFVIYESLKKKVLQQQQHRSNRENGDDKGFWDFAGFMLCGACSKTCATIVAYPHEVARTRLREDGSKYRSFWPTIAAVAREEGRTGLYRGLTTQLLRQIPNTAIMMATYELTVYLMTRYVRNQGGGAEEPSHAHRAEEESIKAIRHKSSHSQ